MGLTYSNCYIVVYVPLLVFTFVVFQKRAVLLSLLVFGVVVVEGIMGGGYSVLRYLIPAVSYTLFGDLLMEGRELELGALSFFLVSLSLLTQGEASILLIVPGLWYTYKTYTALEEMGGKAQFTLPTLSGVVLAAGVVLGSPELYGVAPLFMCVGVIPLQKRLVVGAEDYSFYSSSISVREPQTIHFIVSYSIKEPPFLIQHGGKFLVFGRRLVYELFDKPRFILSNLPILESLSKRDIEL